MAITVIGAGVAGLTVALALRSRGATVRVMERGAAIGSGACSWQAGGMLAPWCERVNAHALVSELGSEAISYWLLQGAHVVRHGSLVVAGPRDHAELQHFARRTHGFEWVDRQTIGALEPSLADRFDRGLFFPGEAHLDPRQGLGALVEKLAGLKCPVQFGQAFAADMAGSTIVDCRGIEARDRLADLWSVRGETVTLLSRDVTLTRAVRLLHPRHPVYAVPRADGRIVVGATMIESDHKCVTARGMMELLAAAYALHPALAEAKLVEMSAELRPAFPDNLPRIRRDGQRVHVNGFYRHGFLLAPSLAWRAADFILEGKRFPEVMA